MNHKNRIFWQHCAEEKWESFFIMWVFFRRLHKCVCMKIVALTFRNKEMTCCAVKFFLIAWLTYQNLAVHKIRAKIKTFILQISRIWYILFWFLKLVPIQAQNHFSKQYVSTGTSMSTKSNVNFFHLIAKCKTNCTKSLSKVEFSLYTNKIGLIKTLL